MTLACHLGQPGSSHCPSGSLSFLFYKVRAAGGRRGEWIHVHAWLSPFTVHLKLSHVPWLCSSTHTHNAAGGLRGFTRGATPHPSRGSQWKSSFHVCFPDRGLGVGASVTGSWTWSVREDMSPQAAALLTTTLFTYECGTMFQDYSHIRGHLFLSVRLGSYH